MKINYTTAIESPKARFMSQLQLQTLFVVTFILLGFTKVNAQIEEYTKPSWMFGVAAGANFNFYGGSTFMLNDGFTPPTAFHDG